MKLSAADWQVRAAAYELLKSSFRYPDQSLVDVLVSEEYGEALAEIAGALGVEPPEGSADALAAYKDADPEDLPHTLRAEATRLFVGAPDPAVSPYEGVWRAADDGVQALLFVNPHSMAVERFMKSCGVGQAQGKNEPLDHVSTELEFLMYLALLTAGATEPAPGVEVPEGGWAAAHDRFLEEHASIWMARFAEKVAAETREPFYGVAVDLLAKMIRAQALRSRV